MRVKIDGRELDNFTKAWYELNLNEKSRAQIHMEAQIKEEKALVTQGKVVEFYDRAGHRVFKGRITARNQQQSGTISLRIKGEEHYQYSNKAVEDTTLPNSEDNKFRDTLIKTIYESILENGTTWSTSDVTAPSTEIDFKAGRTESLWNALQRLRSETAVEFKVDYENEQVVVNSRIGTDQPVTLTENQDISPVDYEEREPEGKRVVVYGKGRGENQVIGSAEDGDYSIGDPLKKVTDPNIINEEEANRRAEKELQAIKLPPKNYDFSVIEPSGSGREIDIGDTFTLDAPSTGVDKERVRVVTLRRGVVNGRETLKLEVSNEEYSKRMQTLAEDIVEQKKRLRDTDTNEDGSGNTTEWGNSINANNEFPLRTVFFIPERKIIDEGGRNIIKSFTIDYEVEPFKESSGTATEDDTEPPLTNSKTDDHNHDVLDFGHDHDTPSETSDQDDTSTDLSTYNSGVTSGYNIRTVNVPSISGGRAFIIASFYLSVNREGASFSDGGYRVTIRSGGIIRFQRSNICSNYENWTMSFALPPDEAVSMEIEDNSNNLWNYAYGITACAVSRHQHDIPPSFTDDNSSDLDELDRDPDVTGWAEAHNHNVEIGTGLGESADINTNGVDIYLDYWDESNEQWIEKTSISRPHNTVDREIDLSNGGQYPNEAGFWRVRVYTQSSDPDYLQNIVNLEHTLPD